MTEDSEYGGYRFCEGKSRQAHLVVLRRGLAVRLRVCALTVATLLPVLLLGVALVVPLRWWTARVPCTDSVTINLSSLGAETAWQQLRVGGAT